MAEMSSRVKAEFERLKASDSRLAAMRKRLETSSDLSAVSEYSRRLAELTRQAIESRTDPGELDITEAQKILDELLRDNYNEVNTLCEEVQRRADKKAGIGLNPQRADYPAERVRTVAGAAAFAKTDEQKVRRLASPAENITESFHSDYVQTNAEYRSSAGLDAYIVRTDGAGCCKWCAALAGKFKYPDEIPDDIFRRHDNCTCDVSYVSSKGRQNVHTKKWTNEPRKIEYEKPAKLTRAEAQARESEILEQRRLTYDSKRDIIRNIKIEDFVSSTNGATIQQAVAKTIFDILSETNSQYLFDKVVVVNLDPKIVMQTDPVRKGTFFDTTLNLNERFLGGKTVSQLDEEIKASDVTVANSLREAVIHEKYHAKLISGLNQDQLESLYDILSDYHIDGISPTAWKDGSECIAEVGVLFERGETDSIPQKAKDLFNKYIGGIV